MSPIQNNHYCQYIPPCLCTYWQGSWYDMAGSVAGTIVKRVTATTSVWRKFSIPLHLPSTPTQLTGARLLSVEIDYEVLGLALVNYTSSIKRITSGEDGAVSVVESLAFSYDSAHDTAAECGAVRKHRLTMTLTSPPWIDAEQYVLVQVEPRVNNGITYHFLGAFANFYWRD